MMRRWNQNRRAARLPISRLACELSRGRCGRRRRLKRAPAPAATLARRRPLLFDVRARAGPPPDRSAMTAARRVLRRLPLTILSVIVVARAAPAANDASDTTPAPASAITVDIPAVDDSLPGSTVVYLPYYGGAAGQYLAVTRDPSGAILDQRIVPADRVPGVAQKPASPESVERAVRALQILAAEALAERKRTTRTARLRALAAASVDLLQLLWRSGIGIDADSARYSENDVGEEGEDAVELETDSSTDEPPPAGLIADAKPVGIAVVGASGVAAARPVGTAVAASGVALARPVATAIAGLDPAAVGISLDLGHSRYGLRPSPTLFDRND